MNYQTTQQLDQLAWQINSSYNLEEINYLVAHINKKRLEEVRKALPYGSYASSSNVCPYCGK